MATERNQSFIRVLQGDRFSFKLKIPSAFLQCFNGSVPSQCCLRTRGKGWIVYVEKVNNKFYFQLGWNGFVQDNGLVCGERLLFDYAGNSQFHVEVFGINTCKKLCVTEMEEANEHQDEISLDILDDFPPCPRKIQDKSLLSSHLPHKRNKTSSSGKADITLSFPKRFPHLEKSAMKKKDAHWFKSEMINISDNDSCDHDEKEYEDDVHNEEDEDENEDGEEEEDDEMEEEDDDSVETHNESSRCSRKVGKLALILHQRKRKSSNAKGKTKVNAAGGLSGEEKILGAIALQRANIFKSNSVDPCFVVSLSATYASGSFLAVPCSFAEKHLKYRQPGHITLRVEKRFWYVKMLFAPSKQGDG
ncbi:hypothetical protein ACLB2K_001225 [Fragaria x ananassa]